MGKIYARLVPPIFPSVAILPSAAATNRLIGTRIIGAHGGRAAAMESGSGFRARLDGVAEKGQNNGPSGCG